MTQINADEGDQGKTSEIPAAGAVAFSAEARLALNLLGMGESEQQGLAAGKPVAFTLQSAAEGTVSVAQLTAEGRLRLGIYTIRNVGGGLSDLLSFEARAQAAARALGARELELLAIEVTNPRLEAVLKRGGFTPTTMPAPDELGGGTFDAIARVEPLNPLEEPRS
jgi:hypothetical protein